jgi:hypothetical protein
MTLAEEFGRIKNNHKEAIKIRVAKVCFSGSTSRVFESKSSSGIKEKLRDIDVDELLKIETEAKFQIWFEKTLEEVVKAVPDKTSRGEEISEGARKWGYGTKILNLFVRDIVLHSRYFTDTQSERMQKFLYVPIDGIIIDKLCKSGEKLCFDKIKEIDTREKFYEIQNRLGRAASECGAPRVWFDDNWGNRK